MVFFYEVYGGSAALPDGNLVATKSTEAAGGGAAGAKVAALSPAVEAAATANAVKLSDCVVYMGADKHENEGLIEWGHPTDVWFHVDKLSSAHVYLRLPIEAAPDCRCEKRNGHNRCACYLDRIPDATIEDMCQLVKANSIDGCKQASVRVVYTPWANLHKDEQTMKTGAVGFHDPKLRRYRTIDKARETVKRIERTKEERFPDLQKERREYDRRVTKVRLAYDRALADAADSAAAAVQAEKDATLLAEAEEFLKPKKAGVKALHLDDYAAAAAAAAEEEAEAAGPPAPPSEHELAAMSAAAALTFRPAWEQEAAAREAEPDAGVAWLRERGYGADAARAALDAARGAEGAGEEEEEEEEDGCRVAALATLHRAAVAAALADAGDEPPPPPADPDDADERERAAAERAEERECLEAIFAPEELAFAAPSDPARLDVALAVVAYEALEGARPEDGAPGLTLELYADRGVAPLYPGAQPPVLALRGGGLPEGALAALGASLGRHAAASLENGPLAFELAGIAADEAVAAAEAELEKKRQAEEAAKRAHAQATASARIKAGFAAPVPKKKLTEEEKAARRLQRAEDAKKRLGAFYDPLKPSALAREKPAGAEGGGAASSSAMVGEDGFEDEYCMGGDDDDGGGLDKAAAAAMADMGF